MGLRKEFQNTPPLLIGEVHATSSATTVLTQTLATNVFKQYATPFPLLFATAGTSVPSANPPYHFPNTVPASGAAKLSPEL
jgi:hypothetical protein